MGQDELGWVGVIRLGLVQAALGAIVILTTSTLNRVMVVELALPAVIPGALVTLHHAMQLLRPRMGHGSDRGRRCTPWIVGGMAALAVGGTGAAYATTLMATHFALGLVASIAAFVLIGAGVSASGTSLLVLMAKRVPEGRRAAAATVTWMMMIASFALTATLAGHLLDPFSPSRLVAVAGVVSAMAFVVTLLAMWGVERGAASVTPSRAAPAAESSFLHALHQVWSEPAARRFTLFVFVSMVAYSAQDLILEPFAGAIFSFSPGSSTKLSGTQHAGVFVGMLLVAVVTTLFRGTALASLKAWVVGGCIASALAMVGLVLAGLGSGSWPLRQNVFLLGAANGAFSIAAIGAMMALASHGRESREGVRMGIWGAAQAIAFGLGGFAGTAVVDLAKHFVSRPGAAYALVFALEALGFVVAQWLALGVSFRTEPSLPAPLASRVSAATFSDAE
jgi:BCD family chlorophyll transporter-like MFS transporter